MTRTEKLAALEAKWFPRLQAKMNIIEQAKAAYDELYAAYVAKREAVNAYFDALEQKPKIDAVIRGGEPAE